MNKFSLIFLVLATSFHSNQKPVDLIGRDTVDLNSLPGKTAYYRQTGSFPLKGITNTRPGRMQNAIFTIEDQFEDAILNREISLFDRNTLKLVVDTSSKVLEISTVYDSKYLQFRNQMHKSYRATISTRIEEATTIGLSEHLLCQLEARDHAGIWRVIEDPVRHLCGTGLQNIFLKKNQMAQTVVPIYEGPFATKCRIRMGENYSNTFDASINPSQFINDGM